MFPDPTILGPFSFSNYGILTAIALLAALLLFSFTAKHRDLSPLVVRNFSFWIVLSGLICARIAYVIFHWPQFSANYLNIFAYWQGGLMFQGSFIGALLLSPIFLKTHGLKFWPTADVLAPSLALGQGIGRLGCLSAGCCYGRPTDAETWGALVFPHGSLAPANVHLWPTQPVESLGLFIIAIFLVWAIRSDRKFFQPRGRIAALYLTAAGALRLFLENWRGDFRGEALFGLIPPTTFVAVLALLLGLLALYWRRA